MAATGAVRLVFVGTGGIAKTHATAARGIEGVRVVAAVDPNPATLDSFIGSHEAPGFASFDEALTLIGDGELGADAVVVCAPPNIRRSVVEPSLERGLAVLVEKPLASTPDEARALAGLARSGGPATAVGYCHRFVPALLEMKRRLETGDLGRLTRFENTFAFHHPGMASAWFSDPAVSGGGSFLDTGCHSLDIFQFLVGSPERVAVLTDHAWPGRGESSATALFRAGSGPHAGVAGVIQAGWLESTRFRVRLVGTEATFVYDYERPEVLLRLSNTGEREELAVETHEVRFARQLEAFAGAVREGKPAGEAGLADFADGLVVAEAAGNPSG